MRHYDRRAGSGLLSNEWYKGQIYRWENGKVTKHTFSLDGYDHLSEAVPVPGTGRITMIHAVSGKGRMEECLLELDMDTGRCRIAPLPGMGEGLKLRWFTGDWLLVQGNGEILSDDFAQLINRNTREVLRIRPEMFGGEKMQHIGILTDGTVVIVTRRDMVGPVFRYPIDFWGFLRSANKRKKLEPWREYGEAYPNLPIFLPPKATERKIILKKDSLTILGSVFTPPFTLSQLSEKLGPRPHCPAKWNTEKPHDCRESPYTQALALWDELGLQGWLDEDEQIIKTLGVRVAAQGEYAVRQTFDGAVWIGSKDYREGQLEGFRRICPYPQIRRLYCLYPLCRVLFQRSSPRRKQSWRPSLPWCRSAGKSQRKRRRKRRNTSYPSRLNQCSPLPASTSSWRLWKS